VFTVDRELHDETLSALDQAQQDGVRAEDLATSTKEIKDLQLRINIAVNRALQEGALPTEDKELRKLCDGCQFVASSLLEKMQGLRNSGKRSGRMPRQWTNFREALATVMSADEISEIEARMDRYQRGINVALLTSLRYVMIHDLDVQLSYSLVSMSFISTYASTENRLPRLAMNA
jgi:hypothetical protein